MGGAKKTQMIHPDLLDNFLNSYLDWINTGQLPQGWTSPRNGQITPREFAAEAVMRLVKAQLFMDGNKRFAATLGDILRVRAGLSPVFISLHNRVGCFSMLEAERTTTPSGGADSWIYNPMKISEAELERMLWLMLLNDPRASIEEPNNPIRERAFPVSPDAPAEEVDESIIREDKIMAAAG
jgi:hypothetical protein